MNLNMIRSKMKQNIYYFQLLKNVKRLLTKLIEKQKRHRNSKTPE